MAFWKTSVPARAKEAKSVCPTEKSGSGHHAVKRNRTGRTSQWAGSSVTCHPLACLMPCRFVPACRARPSTKLVRDYLRLTTQTQVINRSGSPGYLAAADTLQIFSHFFFPSLFLGQDQAKRENYRNTGQTDAQPALSLFRSRSVCCIICMYVHVRIYIGTSLYSFLEALPSLHFHFFLFPVI